MNAAMSASVRTLEVAHVASRKATTDGSALPPASSSEVSEAQRSIGDAIGGGGPGLQGTAYGGRK